MLQSRKQAESNLQEWLQALRAGESRATERLWKLYFEKMVRLARRKLDGSKRIARDEEDIALSAFKSFCLGLRDGRFSDEPAAVDLWPILMTLTLNKAIDHIRHSNRKKRKVPSGAIADAERGLIEHLASPTPLPELEVAARESFDLLLGQLDNFEDSTLRQLAVLRINGASVQEISNVLDCTGRTVQRKLKTIRAIWNRVIDELH